MGEIIDSDQFRKWHYLPGNKGSNTPASCLFFDTETVPTEIPDRPDDKIQLLRLWGAVSVRLEGGKVTRRKEHQGELRESFWSMVNSLMHPRRLLWAFAHNACFDLTELHLWQLMEEGKLAVKCIPGKQDGKNRRKTDKEWNGLVVLNSPPLIIECCRPSDGARVIFLDTMNWYRCSLAKLGETLGFPKSKMPDFADSDEEWYEYCLQDCRIIEKAMVLMVDIVKSHEMGNFRYTASSQAMNFYRHKFNQHGIVIHGNKEATELERESYFGGECRVFQKVKVVPFQEYNQSVLAGTKTNGDDTRCGSVYVVDCQSFYPSIMRENKFPKRLLYACASPSIRELENACENCLVVARVKLASKYHEYPYKLKDRGLTIMATGHFVTTLATPELRRAIINSSIQSVGRMAVYEPAMLFREYMDYCYAQRIANRDKPEIEQFWKLISNSLAGKFGQRNADWECVPGKIAPLPWGEWSELDLFNDVYETFRSIAWQAQLKREVGEARDSFPAISSHVTAYGRERMLQYREIAGLENIYYQDTDSLHVNEFGYANLCSANEVTEGVIGKLRLVSTHDYAEYISPKHYWLDSKPVCSGIKPNAKYLGGERWQQEQWQGIHQIIRAAPPEGIHVKTIEVDRSKDFIPGRIHADGTVSSLYIVE